ncbi:VanZ family protein [Lacticaseibacillus thailandensis]|uniref:VanZ family protein n=1 Tax=Lacticaseibacillus thailandensis TaxID=381741 RepID=UPI0007050AE9
MLFLGPFYTWIAGRMAATVNHWPLIRLIIYSLDKTILYTLIFVVVRTIWLVCRHQRVRWWHEVGLLLFVVYLILLLALTVFRGAQIYFPWNLHPDWGRDTSVINLRPLVGSWQLFNGTTRLDFYYQTFGNVLWFMPLGLLWPALGRRGHRLWGTACLSLLLSLGIECWQFLLATGIADIDDVIFNFIGGLVGYGLYRIGRGLCGRS